MIIRSSSKAEVYWWWLKNSLRGYNFYHEDELQW